MEGEAVLTLYCKASDYDAATNVCAAPFYGPSQGLLPNLSAEDGVLISAAIIATWGIGFVTKQGRNIIGNKGG